MIRKFWNDRSEQRVHLVGEHVGVCWNFDWVKTPEGRGRKKTEGAPYIDAFHVYGIDEYGVGDVDLCDPLKGGLGLEFTKQIHKELGDAIEYIEEMKNESS